MKERKWKRCDICVFQRINKTEDENYIKASIFIRFQSLIFKPVSTFVKCQLGKTKSLWPGSQHPLLTTGTEVTSDHYAHTTGNMWSTLLKWWGFLFFLEIRSFRILLIFYKTYYPYFLTTLHTLVYVVLQSNHAAELLPHSNKAAFFGSK